MMTDNDALLNVAHLPSAAACGLPSSFWVIADTHFGHHNLLGYTGRPDDVDAWMILQWQERVAPDDVVVHLGDLAFGRRDDLPALLAQLPGRLYLVRGNHDRQSAVTYARLGITLIPPCTLRYGEWVAALTHYPHRELVAAPHRRCLNVHGHIHERLGPDLRLLNLSVEWTDYAPVQIENVLVRHLDALARVPAAFEPPLGYAAWLANTYGGAQERSDVTRFPDEQVRACVRETYASYRESVLAMALAGAPETPHGL